MIHSRVVLAIVLVLPFIGGCRGETAAPSDSPKVAAGAEPSGSAASHESPAGAREPSPPPDDGAPPRAGTQEPSMTTPTPANEPPGPPLSAADVAPAFQRWWKTWSSEHLAAHPLRARLDERVAAGGKAKSEACDVLADHVTARAPTGSPELLFGDPAALRGRGDRCWWLHHDGMMGPGLGAALASDGKVLVVWVVLEG